MASITFVGFAYDDAGCPVACANVSIYPKCTTSCAAATGCTDACGKFSITVCCPTGEYDVETASGNSKRRIKADDARMLSQLYLADCSKITLGTGADACIYYNGTHLMIEPRAVGCGNVVVNDEAQLWVGPAAASGNQTHGQATTALVVNQEGSDNLALALKSSDIATGMTTNVPGSQDVETDDFLAIGKESATLGGTNLLSMAEDACTAVTLRLQALGGTANTAKTVGGAAALTTIYVSEHNGSNALANITANGNVFGVQARVGCSNVMRILVDEDGDFYSVTAAQTFDCYCDLALLETYDAARSGNLKEAIKAEHGRWAEYNEQSLIEAGILGAPVASGGMTNWTQTTRVVIGGVRQLAYRQNYLEQENRDLREAVQSLTEQVKGMLNG